MNTVLRPVDILAFVALPVLGYWVQSRTNVFQEIDTSTVVIDFFLVGKI